MARGPLVLIRVHSEAEEETMGHDEKQLQSQALQEHVVALEPA